LGGKRLVLQSQEPFAQILSLHNGQKASLQNKSVPSRDNLPAIYAARMALSTIENNRAD